MKIYYLLTGKTFSNFNISELSSITKDKIDAMDLRASVCEGLYPKCIVCSMSFYETIDVDGKNICILCNVVNRCKKCHTTILSGDPQQKWCYSCWDKTCYLSEIIPGKLYLSDYNSSLNYPLLKKHNIQQILTIGKELPPHQTDEFKTMYISLDDAPHENISDHFSTAHDFISKAPTLVHCYAGISRSATLVLAYLILTEGHTLRSALEHCRKVRPIVNPNHGFLQQLSTFEKENSIDDFVEIFKLELN
jgi:hypothetical protein